MKLVDNNNNNNNNELCLREHKSARCQHSNIKVRGQNDF